MYFLRHTKLFQKSLKRIARSGDKKIVEEVDEVLTILISGVQLSSHYRDHLLTGEYSGCRECHIRPDLLLVYSIEKSEMILETIDIGSHSYLFD